MLKLHIWDGKVLVPSIAASAVTRYVTLHTYHAPNTPRIKVASVADQEEQVLGRQAAATHTTQQVGTCVR
jgi:hypothetical protein